jgi:hypothetical protein
LLNVGDKALGTKKPEKKIYNKGGKSVMLLFTLKASAIKVAPVTPILLPFECWKQNFRLVWHTQMLS